MSALLRRSLTAGYFLLPKPQTRVWNYCERFPTRLAAGSGYRSWVVGAATGGIPAIDGSRVDSAAKKRVAAALRRAIGRNRRVEADRLIPDGGHFERIPLPLDATVLKAAFYRYWDKLFINLSHAGEVNEFICGTIQRQPNSAGNLDCNQA